MLLRPRNPCCLSNPILLHRCISPKLLYHQLRAYSSPQPRLYKDTPKAEPHNDPSKTRSHIARKSQSSSTVPLQGVLPNKTTSDPLKPPSTTQPPLLSLPSRPPNLPVYKYYFRLGKAYAQFYKTGLKAIYTNWKTARALPNGVYKASQDQMRAAVYAGTLSRADFQLIRRAKNDVHKLPLFILVWLVCGEFTPLVVIFVSGLVPRIIWIPKQVQGAREKAEARRHLARQDSTVHFPGPLSFEIIDQMDQPRQTNTFHYYGRSLGLYPAWWDRLPGAFDPTRVIRERVKQRVEYLEVDNFAVARDGGVERLEGQEVVWACEDRGIDVLGKGQRQLRSDLKAWMEARWQSEEGQ